MRELYVRKKERPDLKEIVPVKIGDRPFGFDNEVKKRLNLLKEESVELKKLSEIGEEESIGKKFDRLVDRMIKLVQDEGCYYPEIENEISSVVLKSGGPSVSVIFHSMGIGERLRRVPRNCKLSNLS